MFTTAATHNKTQSEQVRCLYTVIETELSQAQIQLNITRKRVKNINFRLKPYQLSVSAPYFVSDVDIINALSKRLDWVVNHHTELLKRHQQKQQLGGHHSNTSSKNGLSPIKLWGETQNRVMSEAERLHWYRHELQSVMLELFQKWQPVVGKVANETRIKKMSTRWGSCNTKAKRIWLSVYLPAFPLPCTEYVIVHELCHLHQANHSPAFWHEVKRSMPDYKRWHDMLAGKSGIAD